MEWGAMAVVLEKYFPAGFCRGHTCLGCMSVHYPNFRNRNIKAVHFFVLRSESKMWSPLVSEEGKAHPYKMNLATEPQVCV